MYSDGFKYWLAHKKNNSEYYRCSRYRTHCPGRCVRKDGKIDITVAHTHDPEPDRVLIEQFRKALTNRASSEKTDLYTIYWEEASQRHVDAAMLYTFTSAESAMRKARRKKFPETPSSITELGSILTHSSLFRINSGAGRDPFYQTTLETPDSACVIFLHKKTLQLVGRVDEIHIDTSVNVVPHTPPNYHLMIMHGIRGNRNVPLIYCIMTAKTLSTYLSIFSYIRDNFSNYIKPNLIVSDFERFIQIALSQTFPEATIKGGWFLYMQAVLQQMRYLDMQSETLKSHGNCGLRMLMAVPLLPAEYMLPGLAAVRKWATEKCIYTQKFAILCDYAEQYWFKAVGNEKMSIFGLFNCIHDHIGPFQADLRTHLGILNPMIWQMLDSLSHMATKMYAKVNKWLREGGSSVKQPKKCQQALNSILQNATQMWIRTPVHLRNPLQYLQLSCNCIEDTHMMISQDNVRQHNASNSQTVLDVLTCSSNSATNSVSADLFSQDNMLLTDGDLICQSLDFGTASVSASYSSGCANQPIYITSDGRTMNSLNQQPTKITSEPPPLVFYPKKCRLELVHRPEPPPLVRIGSKLVTKSKPVVQTNGSQKKKT